MIGGAPVAELVDARDLKSRGPRGPCRFESGQGHQFSFAVGGSQFAVERPGHQKLSLTAIGRPVRVRPGAPIQIAVGGSQFAVEITSTC